MSRRIRHIGAALAVAAASLTHAQISPSTIAQSPDTTHTTSSAAITGVVKDPLGVNVAGATVTLLSGAKSMGSTTSGPDGSYFLTVQATGRYALRVTAPTFEANTIAPRYFRRDGHASVDLTVATPTDTQEITVSATGTPTPIAQVGAAVTVLTSDDFPHVRDIQEPLRYVPGVQITQTGEAGGTSGLFIRGGNTNANKVVIDGIPADDLGGGVEFANIASAGIGSIEVLREPDSALYGSDALAGVVSLTTRRGATPLPLFDYQGDAGNFHTYRNEFSVSGASHQFDYFSDFARQETSNNQVNDEFHNVTFAENVGYQPNSTTDLRFTFRHTSAEGGKPAANSFYGLSSDAFLAEHDEYIGGVLNSQTARNWHNQLRYGGLRLNYLYDTPAPAGIPVYAVVKGVTTTTISSYAGLPVTIVGANGYRVTGTSTLTYAPYPACANGAVFCPQTTANPSKRDFVYAQTDYKADSFLQRIGVNTHMLLLAAFKYEDERGISLTNGVLSGNADRGNYSTMLEIQGDAGTRFFYTIGTGLEENAVYGFAATPRFAGTYYLVRPNGANLFSGTKLHSSFSKGIKSPSIYIENHSLFGLLNSSGHTNVIGQFGVNPVGAEQSRSYDGGLDQEFGQGRARMGLTYFHNEYGNSLEYLSQSVLVNNAGLAFATDTAFAGGAYVNTLSYRGQGLEAELEAKLSRHLFARGGYTLLDARVQHSFASSALKPSINPLFPTIAIGSSSPLVGNRPFRRARNTGYFGLAYTRSRWNAALDGTLVGYRDDSDFLSTALLLPNHNLDGRYQRVELTGEYHFTARLSTYAEIQNLLSEHYQEAFGYPTLPLNFRSGLRLNFGGESWKIK